jgi:hypothetical protein
MGEAIRKDITAPKGAPALKSPTTMGIVEQEQKGVNAPKPAPMIFPQSVFPLPKARCILSWGTYSRRRPTKKVTPIKRSVNSPARRRKITPACVNWAPKLLLLISIDFDLAPKKKPCLNMARLL